MWVPTMPGYFSAPKFLDFAGYSGEKLKQLAKKTITDESKLDRAYAYYLINWIKGETAEEKTYDALKKQSAAYAKAFPFDVAAYLSGILGFLTGYAGEPLVAWIGAPLAGGIFAALSWRFAKMKSNGGEKRDYNAAIEQSAIRAKQFSYAVAAGVVGIFGASTAAAEKAWSGFAAAGVVLGGAGLVLSLYAEWIQKSVDLMNKKLFPAYKREREILSSAQKLEPERTVYAELEKTG